MNAKWLKTIGQWVGIIILLGAAWSSQDRRITRVEEGLRQEMMGYSASFNAMKDLMEAELEPLKRQVDRIEDKLDRLIER